ncbi:hypothetical protein B273_0618 [SAR86 cluster bacterium SAR86E]|uniref:Uncharacterized protein n=1 Tax=SAR86 cluster bacterium SAR86E TaxID=1208365 RepID=K6GG50_9GAMM|nr:hypothetical protein B273_0618 [SAR86 cluster bacterium SAR86E]
MHRRRSLAFFKKINDKNNFNFYTFRVSVFFILIFNPGKIICLKKYAVIYEIIR